MQNERMTQIQERIRKVMADAQARYGVDLSGVQVRFDLRGRCAGMAGYKGGLFGKRAYFLRFNRDMIHTDAFNHLINDTVPHEIAHLACFMRPELGDNHDAGWKRICRELGGSGERCHQEQVVYANGKTFQYKTTAGRLVTVSEKIHRKIQMGVSYTVKRGGGKLLKTCEWVLFKPGVVQLAEGPAAAPAAKDPVNAPVAPKAAAPKTGTSKAEQVRGMIREAKRDGRGQASVIFLAQTVLGMSKSQAQRYVIENWDRA
jgi:predicted SprT family Zn-dependent metalloprotease